MLPYNFVSDVTLPKYTRPEVHPWSEYEVWAFLSNSDSNDDLLAAGWWLALTCGLRRGELCGLRWADIDFVRGEATIRVTRLQDGSAVFVSTPESRRSRRTVALTPGAIDALARLRDVHDEMRTHLPTMNHD